MVRIDWREAWRIIASRYPPIAPFERVAPDDPAIADALIALEQLTNPRLRDEIGEIALVPPEERVSGPGASYVMAPFTHVNPQGSRFSDGRYGVYYAAAALHTAIAETIHHFQLYAADSNDPPRSEDMRVLVGSFRAELEDARALAEPMRAQVLDPDDYRVAQSWGRKLRDAGAAGIFYPSVRHAGGACVAAFSPRVPAIPRQERHLQYHWDGTRVTRYFDYSEERWHDWPAA
jgi:hypothetical protein